MFDFGEKVLGLDIGNREIKWVLYGGSSRRPILYNWGRAPTPTGSVREGKILDKISLKNTLEGILSSIDVKVKKAAVSLSSPEIIVRTVELPNLPKKDMDKAVVMEVEHFFSFSGDDYYMDYRVLEGVEDKKAALTRVLVCILPKSIGDMHIQLLEELRLRPIVFDFHGNCSCRLLKHLNWKDNGSCMIVDIGAASISIVICENGSPVFYRVIQGGGDEITKAVANSYNLSLEEGEKYKLTHGIAVLEKERPREQSIEKEMVNCITPVLQYQVREIYRTLQFYTNKNSKSVNRVVLAGGGSLLKNMDKYLSSYLDIDTVYFTCRDNFIRSKKELSEDMLITFNNVLGLALRGDR